MPTPLLEPSPLLEPPPLPQLLLPWQRKLAGPACCAAVALALLPTAPLTQSYHLQAADGQADALRAELQGQLQWLVANYSTRRASLLEEILPEVGRGGVRGLFLLFLA